MKIEGKNESGLWTEAMGFNPHIHLQTISRQFVPFCTLLCAVRPKKM